MYNYSEDYLMHYGVKGMKWGVRRGISGTIRDMQRRSANKSLSEINTKRKQVNSELRELRGYDRNPSGLAKTKVSTAIRRSQIKSLEKTQSKLNAKAKDNKDALKELDSIEKYQQAKKATNAAQDRKIMDARQKQSDSISGMKKEAKNFALATVSGDKKGKQLATRNASKLIDSYVDNKEVASRATSGEKKVATTMAVIGGATLAVAAAKHAQAGKRVANMFYPGLHYI